MIQIGNLVLKKTMKSTSEGNYMGKEKDILLLEFL